MATMADTAFQRRSAARKRGKAATEARVGVAEDTLGRFDESAEDRQRNIRYGSARGFAAANPQGRIASGGGFMGAASQASLDAEMAGIRQQQQDDRERAGLAMGVVEAEQSAAEYDAQSGSDEEDYIQALGDAEDAIELAIRENRGWVNDSESAMESAVRAEAAKIRGRHPDAARELENKYLREGASGYKQIHNN